MDERKAKTVFNKFALPYSVYFRSEGEQVFAVKFLFMSHSEISEKFDIFPLSMRLMKPEGVTENLLNDESRNKFIDGIGVGIFFMMAFIHFFFFHFFRSQQYNLSFSISMLLFGIFLCLGTSSVTYENFNNYVNIKLASKIMYLMAHILLLNAIYEYLQYPKKILFWGIISMLLLMNTLTLFQVIKEIFVFLTITLLISNYTFLI